jgi:hypothetical protein
VVVTTLKRRSQKLLQISFVDLSANNGMKGGVTVASGGFEVTVDPDEMMALRGG